MKLRGVKPQLPPATSDADKSKIKDKTSSSDTSAKDNSSKSPLPKMSQPPPDHSRNSGYGYQQSAYSTQGSGSWYPQDKGNTLATQQYPTDVKVPPPTSSYTSGYTTNVKPTTNYLPSHPPPTTHKSMASGKDVGGYPTQPPPHYSSHPPPVMNIFNTTSAPPPPPPMNQANTYGYGVSINFYLYYYTRYYSTS